MRERVSVSTTSVNSSHDLEGEGEEEEENKTLERYLDQSKDLLWVNMYRKACEGFTYPKCPQLLTSQGLVNSANRKRALPDGAEPSEKPKKANKKKLCERDRTSSGDRLDSESTQQPVKSKQLEDLWVHAESFAIFDDEEENETENEEEEDDDESVEESEIVVNEWI
jgi:hypothetical protein